MKVVCYGDSNTYGYTPLGLRYDNRFSILLKRYFNNKIDIYEEGYLGRTTVFKESDINRCGILDIDSILLKYEKIDLLIIMLGTNDYKIKNARSLDELKDGMDLLLDKINKLNICKKILLISPILLAKNIKELDYDFDDLSYELSKDSNKVYKELSIKYNTLFLDAKDIANPGLDGEHLTLDGHFRLASELIKIINKEVLNNE